jgi:hypothetical protein
VGVGFTILADLSLPRRDKLNGIKLGLMTLPGKPGGGDANEDQLVTIGPVLRIVMELLVTVAPVNEPSSGVA